MLKGTKHEDIEKLIVDELEKIKTEGITEDELKRAKAQITTSIILARDGPLAIAGSINESIAVGDWKYHTGIIDLINGVTVEQIQQVANKYLLEDRKTVGYFIPKSDEQAKQSSTKEDKETFKVQIKEEKSEEDSEKKRQQSANTFADENQRVNFS